MLKLYKAGASGKRTVQSKKSGNGCVSGQLGSDCGREAVAWTFRTSKEHFHKAGMCGSRTGKAYDDLPKALC